MWSVVCRCFWGGAAPGVGGCPRGVQPHGGRALSTRPPSMGPGQSRGALRALPLLCVVPSAAEGAASARPRGRCAAPPPPPPQAPPRGTPPAAPGPPSTPRIEPPLDPVYRRCHPLTRLHGLVSHPRVPPPTPGGPHSPASGPMGPPAAPQSVQTGDGPCDGGVATWPHSSSWIVLRRVCQLGPRGTGGGGGVDHSHSEAFPTRTDFPFCNPPPPQ